MAARLGFWERAWVYYPKENKKLFEKVLERGAIISELPTGSHPAPENFLARNRIINGMPLGMVIVEGNSGSLITARLAMEVGREVFGVPGNMTQEVSFAPNQLIKQGTKLVTSAEDVIEELPTPVRTVLCRRRRSGVSSGINWRRRVNSNRAKDLRAVEH